MSDGINIRGGTLSLTEEGSDSPDSIMSNELIICSMAFAILGYSGGKCKQLAQYPIHFEIEDMQISEDLQLIVGHMCMQWLAENGKGEV